MRRIGEAREGDGVTYVVEFIMSFLIFLMIMLAYFTASGVNLAPYVPEEDYLPSEVDEIAEVFIDNPGQFGNNSTTWENRTATQLEANMTGLGLARDGDSYGVLSESKIVALGNLTYSKLKILLNLQVLENINVTIQSSSGSGVNISLGFGFGNQKTVVTSERRITVVNATDTYEAVFVLKLFEGGVLPLDLRINEINYLASVGEWVELYNSAPMALNLSQYQLGTTIGSGTLVYFAGDAVLPSGSYAVIATNGSWPAAINSSALNISSNAMVGDTLPDVGIGTVTLLLRGSGSSLSQLSQVQYNVTALGNPTNPIFLNATGGWEESSVASGTPGWANL